ncbi:hypothetical protein [Trinickia sp. EG282A]|uniref:hypothetical protein n=1 Tax=Trinickia sp. EG282A TaxID=3237013 RepID=UPI0034D37498
MEERWQYQVRIDVTPELAEALRAGALHPCRDAIELILRRCNATLVCQFDAFTDYVAEAERAGPERYPLYRWTKETIGNPEKKAKYLKSFTVYVGGEPVYERDIADQLHARLSALVANDGIQRVLKFDTNPANNPQPPAQQ